MGARAGSSGGGCGEPPPPGPRWQAAALPAAAHLQRAAGETAVVGVAERVVHRPGRGRCSAYMPSVTTSQPSSNSRRVSAAVTAFPSPRPGGPGWTAIDDRCPTPVAAVVSAAQATRRPAPRTPTQPDHPGCRAGRSRSGSRPRAGRSPPRRPRPARPAPRRPVPVGRGRERKSQSVPCRPTHAGSQAADPRGSVTRWRGAARDDLARSAPTFSGVPSADRYGRCSCRSMPTQARALDDPAAGQRPAQRAARERVVAGRDQHLGGGRQRGGGHGPRLAAARTP